MNKNELKEPPQSSIPKPKAQRSRKEVQQEVQQAHPERSSKNIRMRLIPVWLRVLLVLVLFVGAATIGLIIGYSGIGDGQAADALKWDTWQHLLDIIDGKE